MTAPSDSRLLVLHGLRLKGFAHPPAVSEVVAVSEGETVQILEQLVGDGLVTYREGRLSGFSLTPDGRSELAQLLSEELDLRGVRDDVNLAYAKFLGLNSGLLEVCTAWQLRDVDGESVLNDHTDTTYDAQVIERLAELNGTVRPVCDELGASLARYVRYSDRLAHAVDRVRAGEIEWFTKPVIASYHTVWFELHEDLLATLGIERGSEAVG